VGIANDSIILPVIKRHGIKSLLLKCEKEPLEIYLYLTVDENNLRKIKCHSSL